MQREEIIVKLEEILKTKDEQAIKECVVLIETLSEIAFKHEPDAAQEAFEDFFNYKTLNYLSDEKLEKVTLNKWQKDYLRNLLEQNKMDICVDGFYNFNALVLAMNYEYIAHKNTIESTGKPVSTAYSLADDALRMEGYIEHAFDHYMEKD